MNLVMKSLTFKVVHTLVCYTFVYVLALEDVIYVYGQGSVDMVEQGKQQYQILKERGSLPQFGTCWKTAIDHVNEGCRALNEDTQSDIALHFTNCFLEMSGHEKYTCELDKKPNLRGICINSMTDRAFMVYTEFYTHTQNICWFLRGQVWNEMMAENTVRVSKQLEQSAANQEDLLKTQQESVVLQEKLLSYEKHLEKFMNDFYLSTKEHSQILSVIMQSVGDLQSWIIGEISFFESVIFYVITTIVVFVLTATKRTYVARLPILFLLALNVGMERFIASTVHEALLDDTVQFAQKDYYRYIWYSRNSFIILSALLLCIAAYFYKDYIVENNMLLKKMYAQNERLYQSFKALEAIREIKNGNCSYVSEKGSPEASYNKINSYITSIRSEISKGGNVTYDENAFKNTYNNALNVSAKARNTPIAHPLTDHTGGRYNLRSRQGTPEILAQNAS